MKLRKDLEDLMEKYRNDAGNYLVLKEQMEQRMNALEELERQNLERLQKKFQDELRYTQDSVEKFVNKLSEKIDLISEFEKRLDKYDSVIKETKKLVD
jgi:peptidoglycan hydrolase CwlO-like protein